MDPRQRFRTGGATTPRWPSPSVPAGSSGTLSTSRGGPVVLSAHRDGHFRFLRNPRPGDEIEIETALRRARCRIDECEVLDSRRESLLLDNTRPSLWLITCDPFVTVNPGGSMRYAVGASRVAAEAIPAPTPGGLRLQSPS